MRTHLDDFKCWPTPVSSFILYTAMRRAGHIFALLRAPPGSYDISGRYRMPIMTIYAIIYRNEEGPLLNNIFQTNIIPRKELKMIISLSWLCLHFLNWSLGFLSFLKVEKLIRYTDTLKQVEW